MAKMTKKFGNEIFNAISQHKSKRQAEALAKQYRSFGFKARVEKIGKVSYRVYIRKRRSK